MQVLIAGANGATGIQVVKQLLARGHHVRALVRSPEKLPKQTRDQENLTIIQASVLELSDEELAKQLSGCGAVVSCLGHNLTFKGIFGQPRRLVTEATRRMCKAIQTNNPIIPTKFVLMNTSGNRNTDLSEQVSFAQRVILFLLRNLVPPHADNEEAAKFLRTQIGQQNKLIEWVAV
jgi:nucleoside-diphosphate-sugar epimerase